MSRGAREKCGNSIYHISSRGNNKQSIFLDDEDRHEYLARLRRYKERYKMHIYAYCLMSNHIHLLVYDNDQDISRFMQGLNLSYALYFNKKYQRCGHLFQERYHSVIIKNDAQLMYASRYIHLNPVKAKIVKKSEAYSWSSYKIYETGQDKDHIVSTGTLLGILSNDAKKARRKYCAYVNSQIEEITQEEIAIAEDAGEDLNEIMIGIPRVSEQQVCCTLEKLWDEKIEYIIRANNATSYERKIILAYLLALLSRKTYKQVGEIMNLKSNEIYKMIKHIVEQMVTRSAFNAQIERLISLRYEKINQVYKKI